MPALRRRLGDENLLTAALHLAVLTTVAVALPLYDLLGRNPEFFVARRSDGGELLALVLTLGLAIPLVLWAPQPVLARVSPRLSRCWQAAAVGALGTLFALPVAKRLLDEHAVAVVGLAVVAGAAGALCYRRSRGLRLTLSLLSPLVLVAPLLFVYGSNVSRAVLDRDDVAAATVTAKTPANVVFLMLDEFAEASMLTPADQIDAIRLPHLAALARESTWYRNATSVSDGTHRAVPAMLTGRYARNNVPATVSFYPRNLFTLLGAAFRLNVHEVVTRLCPANLCAASTPRRPGLAHRTGSLLTDVGIAYLHVVAPRSLRSRLPSVSGQWGNFAADERRPTTTAASPKPGAATGAPADGGADPANGAYDDLRANQADRLTGFLASLRAGGPPTLNYLHLLLPHFRWQYLPSGRRYTRSDDPPGLVGKSWSRSEFLARQGLQRHLMQVSYADKVVGQVVARLKALGSYDDTLLVITGDHGVSFAPGGYRRVVTRANAGELAPVPLIIKLPGTHPGSIDDRNVQTIDIVPTLADALGLRLPWPTDGVDLLDRRAQVPAAKLDYISEGEGRVALPGDMGPARRAAVERDWAAFGRTGGTLDLFAPGRYAGLVGRDVAALADGADDATEVRLDDADRFAHVDPAATLSPNHVTGSVVSGDRRAGRQLAVAVNGRVATVTETFSMSRDAGEISAFLPESSLRRGGNLLEVFEITAAGRLRRLRLAQPDVYALSEAGHALRAADGRRYVVARRRLQAAVFGQGRSDATYTVTGYVYDADRRVPVDRVVLLRDGVSVASGSTSIARADVADRAGTSAVLRSGFRFEVAGRYAGLRLFALVGDAAVPVGIIPSRADA